MFFGIVLFLSSTSSVSYLAMLASFEKIKSTTRPSLLFSTDDKGVKLKNHESQNILLDKT